MLANTRVLLVEDNPDLRTGYIDLLTIILGCPEEGIVSAASVDEALEKGLEFDLVLSDYNLLGERVGAEFVRLARGQGYTGIIIAMSNDKERKSEFLEAGANAFHMKTDGPLALSNLIELLLR